MTQTSDNSGFLELRISIVSSSSRSVCRTIQESISSVGNSSLSASEKLASESLSVSESIVSTSASSSLSASRRRPASRIIAHRYQPPGYPFQHQQVARCQSQKVDHWGGSLSTSASSSLAGISRFQNQQASLSAAPEVSVPAFLFSSSLSVSEKLASESLSGSLSIRMMLPHRQEYRYRKKYPFQSQVARCRSEEFCQSWHQQVLIYSGSQHRMLSGSLSASESASASVSASEVSVSNPAMLAKLVWNASFNLQ